MGKYNWYLHGCDACVIALDSNPTAATRVRPTPIGWYVRPDFFESLKSSNWFIRSLVNNCPRLPVKKTKFSFLVDGSVKALRVRW